jgi:hypothetical protein
MKSYKLLIGGVLIFVLGFGSNWMIEKFKKKVPPKTVCSHLVFNADTASTGNLTLDGIMDTAEYKRNYAEVIDHAARNVWRVDGRFFWVTFYSANKWGSFCWTVPDSYFPSIKELRKWAIKEYNLKEQDFAIMSVTEMNQEDYYNLFK